MTTLQGRFDLALRERPLVAILRGLHPDEALAIGEAIVRPGFQLLEEPLNSPRPLDSIALLRQHFGQQALVGAGTVLTAAQVREVHAAGGQLIVSPNFTPAVVVQALRLGLVPLPGIFTPGEAFAALAAGARALKLFPAELASPAGLRAMRAVLPQGTPLLPVGGITPQGMAVWRDAGAAGFGIGSALYKPGKAASEVQRDAITFIASIA